MTPQEILAKAAEVMAERGKATGTYESEKDDDHFGMKGSVCAYGAMTLTVTEGETSAYSDLDYTSDLRGLVNQAAALLAQRVSSALDDPFRIVTHFNDGSPAEDVILTMKRAAHE